MNTKRSRPLAYMAVRTGLVSMLAFIPSSAFAGGIVVPDGDFTLPGGVGQVGGGIIAASGSSVIGSGPWTGTYNAALGILAPPTLTISSSGGSPSGGKATISGLLAGTNLAGITDTGGYFSQTLAAVNYLPNTTYTLTANIDPGTLLGAGLLGLSNAGVGIGLTNGGALLTDSTNTLLNLTLLGGTNYQLQLNYTTGAVAPTGNLGIRLFDMPTGVAQANVLGNVSFSNVTLNSAGAVPEPSSNVLLLLGGGLCGFAVIREKRRAKQADAVA